MGVTVKFREGTPAADMTREQAMTWLLGNAGELSGLGGFAASWGVGAMLDRIARDPKLSIDITLHGDQRYALTCTRAGKWYRRTYTYHATREGEAGTYLEQLGPDLW